MLQPVKCYLSILLVFIAFGKIPAQGFVSYSTSDGLAHKNATAFYQAGDGYLWVGTWNGLSRFDGQRFTSFKHGPGDTTTIFNDQVNQITGDSTGQIWIVTRKGLVKYLNKRNNFQRIDLRDLSKSAEGSSRFRKICFDHNNRGWMLDAQGLIAFDTDLKSIRYLDISDFHVKYGDILPDSNGIWIATSKGLFHFTFATLNGKTNITGGDADFHYHFTDKRFETPVSSCIITSTGNFMLTNNKRELFISGIGTSFLINIKMPKAPDGSKLRHLGGIISEIIPGYAWVLTDHHGIIIYNLKTGTFEFDHKIQALVGKQIVYSAYRDNQYNIWIGGIEGLYKYTLPRLNFSEWLYDPANENSLSGMGLTSLMKDKHNHLWVATKGGGLDKVDLTTGEIKRVGLPIRYQKLANDNNAFSLFGLNDDELLVSFDSVIFRYNIPKDRFSVFHTVARNAYKIFRDSEDVIWITDISGIIIGKPEGDGLRFQKIPFTDFLEREGSTRDIIEDRKGQMWLACASGLVKFNISDPSVSKLFVPPGSETDPEVFCIHEAGDGIFWIGTIRNGIYSFDPEKGIFTGNYCVKDGLIDNSVNAIFSDNNGRLWMSTWNGIAKFNTQTKRFTNYSTANGLPFPEFNTGAYARDEDGTVYFGGQGGAIAFHPGPLVNFSVEMPIGITNITTLDGRMGLDYPLMEDELIEIPYDQSSINISFNCFDFRNHDERIYKYRLNNYQDEWVQVRGNDLTARFSGLKAGLYDFEVQSTYESWPLEWALNESKIRVRVLSPPFWQHRNFQILIIALFALSLLSTVFLRLRNVNMKKQVKIARLEKEANISTLNFLKSQMNPHFYFNTLNAINSFILQSDMRSANKFLTTFSKLMRETLENSQKEFVTIGEEKEVLIKYLTLQKLRFPDMFEFVIEAGEDVLNKKIPPMFLQPFVENSVEYAFKDMLVKGEVKISFINKNNQITCSVCDNGVGIKKSKHIIANKNRKSTAINNIYNRISLLNRIHNVSIKLEISRLYPENKEFPGTLTKLSIPDFDLIIPEFKH